MDLFRMRATWWWIDRWRKSTAYTDMTLEEQGAYRNLIDEQNLRGGSLPDDERILSRACGDPLAWPRVQQALLARFPVVGPGVRRNETAYQILLQSQRRAEKQERYRNRARNDPGNGGGNASGSPDPDPSPYPYPYPSQDPPIPPLPPPPADAGAGGAEVGAVSPSLDQLIEEAGRYSAERGAPAFRRVRRILRDWFKAGLTLDQVKARIDREEHLPSLMKPR